MEQAFIPENETERLKALQAYEVLDTAEEKSFDELTALAATICQKPISLVSLVDNQRQWFKSHHGLDAQETPRELAFCSHAILENQLFVVENSLEDQRFHDNPLVTGDPKVIFYAGVPLVTPEGFNIGTLCVIDSKPGTLNEEQKRSLKSIANQVVRNLEYRKSLIELKLKNKQAKKICTQLESANEELSQFSYRTSHDLKAPLVTIKGLAEAISEDVGTKDYREISINANRIENTAIQLESFVSDILDLAKAELLEPQYEKINLQDIIDSVEANLSRVYIHNNVELKVKFEHTNTFYSSKTRIHQILENLISNGIKYSDNNKSRKFVLVTSKNLGNSILITVEDNGLGIPKEHQSRIFNMFERFHSDVTQGSGLGLYIVKKHIDKMSAQINIIHSSVGTKIEISFKNKDLT